MKRLNPTSLTFFLFSAVIGLLAGLGAVGFRTLIELFQRLFWLSGTNFIQQVSRSPWWMTVSIPVAGGLAAGLVITRLAQELRGPGVPEVIVAVAAKDSIIRHRVTFLKALVTGMLIGSGASVGREGPIVQIGASVGSSLAQLFRLHTELRRMCVACGAAAGIAATFNAPIAGTMFAVEVILMDLEVVYLGHIVVAAVIGSVVSHVFWGDLPYIAVVAFHLIHYWEMIFYLVLGVASGLVSVLFIRLIYGTDTLFRSLSIPEWVKPGIGGLLLGVLGLKIPQIMGVGYETLNMATAGSLALGTAATLMAAKLVATCLCLGSGMSGGIFAPSLVMGSTLGAALALAANTVFPGVALVPANYALAGMGAIVAGTTLAPITAIITVFELTDAYEVVLPLMVACIASTVVVKLLSGYSVYEMKMIRQGLNIVRGHDVSMLRSLRAEEYMSTEFATLRESSPLAEIIRYAIETVYPHFVVLDDRNELAGVLSLSDLKPSLDAFAELDGVIVAADIMTRNVQSLPADENLEKALHLFERHHISFLPITDPRRHLRVVGILKKDDLLHAYRYRVLKENVLSVPLK